MILFSGEKEGREDMENILKEILRLIQKRKKGKDGNGPWISYLVRN
jgi:hypothetical protein